ELFLGLAGGMALGQALRTTAERSHRTLALLVGRERGNQREPAAALLGPGPRGFRGDGRPGRAAGPPGGPRGFVLVGFLDGGTCAHWNGDHSRGRRLGLLILAEPLLCLGFGLALGLFVVAAALVLVALARLGGFAFDLLAGFPLVAATRLLFC